MVANSGTRVMLCLHYNLPQLLLAPAWQLCVAPLLAINVPALTDSAISCYHLSALTTSAMPCPMTAHGTYGLHLCHAAQQHGLKQRH
jgi:hypothetical protein